ncbi:hypothetical protein ALC57_04439 [Trachymyrmex cornetzi]|uniref:Uncharacterized protein n=1 Tax=Trachymyrmex cornetzi TaxID=471704 RepID=A0A151JCG1_9HYME|nr:hypothetical protein ALC57_04439 [Trachymyrmex cornetzi]
MSFLHTHSSECIKSELDFFSLPPTQTSIESSQWIYYKPVTSLTDDSPIEFVIPDHGEDYLDLTHTMLSLRIRVESERGAAADVAKVEPVNHLLHSMFNQIDVYFNQAYTKLSRNQWFDGDINPTYFTIHLRAITRHARYIYTIGQEKLRYLSNLLSRNVYNLEGISPAFKNLLDFGGCGQRFKHHGFRTNVESHCALRNAYKLKCWLAIRNSSNSSYDSLPSENCSESDVKSEKTNSGIFSIKFKNQKNDIFRNIEA